MSTIKEDSIRGFKWSGLNSVFTTTINFVIGIILARLLTPSDYGIVGMTAIFFSVANIFIDSGFNAALIQKKELKRADASTIFYFNIGVSCLIYTLLFVAAPFIANILQVPILRDIIRILGLHLIFSAFGSVHFILMTKSVDFKTPTLLGIPLTLLQGGFGIYMAYKGYGVWALVYPNLFVSIIRSIAIWLISSWRPLLTFSKESLKEMFSFGSNLAINSILDKLMVEGTSLLIGRFYTLQNLGYYSKGMTLAQLPSTFLFNVVGSVTFPVLAKIQNDDAALKNIYGKYIKILSMVIFFVMFLLIALAKPLVFMLYTEKWENSIIFVQLFCLAFMLYHIHAVNWNLLLVKGRSDLALKKEIINKSVRFSLLFITVPLGVIPICLAMIAGSVFDLFVNTYFTGKVCGFGIKEQASDFAPYMIMSVVSCLPAWLITLMPIYPAVAILSGGALASVLYIGWLKLRNDDSFNIALEIICKRLER